MRQLFDFSKLKQTRVLVAVALLIALDIVFNLLLRWPISQQLEVNFNFIALVMNGSLFGPAIAGLAAGLGDILGYFLSPINGAFHPGFTLNAIVAAVIYGIGFYKQSVTWQRVILVMAVETLIVSLIMTPIWLNMMYQVPLLTQARFIKALILLPIRVVLTYFVLKIAEREFRKRF